MRIRTGTFVLLAFTVAATLPRTAGAAQRLIDARQVASDTLRDVAVTVFVHDRAIIYYNPTLLQTIGPELSDFFIAHEYGHARYGEAGAALTATSADWSALRQRQELEADCYATQVLAERNPEAVQSAIAFFRRMGPFRFDNLHPSGAQRAAKILACLPER
jgi:hypothetical protein